MADQSNAHSSAQAQEFPISAPNVILDVYHLLNADVRIAAERLDLDHDEVMQEIFRLIVCDMFDAGTKPHEIHDAIYEVRAAWKQECR